MVPKTEKGQGWCHAWAASQGLLLRTAVVTAHLLESVAAVLRADIAGAVAAPLRVEGLPKVRQQHCAPALDLLLTVRNLQSSQNFLASNNHGP